MAYFGLLGAPGLEYNSVDGFLKILMLFELLSINQITQILNDNLDYHTRSVLGHLGILTHNRQGL